VPAAELRVEGMLPNALTGAYPHDDTLVIRCQLIQFNDLVEERYSEFPGERGDHSVIMLKKLRSPSEYALTSSNADQRGLGSIVFAMIASRHHSREGGSAR
jgi:hypothetical protein